jgi:hypothetical protein
MTVLAKASSNLNNQLTEFMSNQAMPAMKQTSLSS